MGTAHCCWKDKVAAFPRPGPGLIHTSRGLLFVTVQRGRVKSGFLIVWLLVPLCSLVSCLPGEQFNFRDHRIPVTKDRHIPGTHTASPGGNRLAPMHQGSASPNLESLVYTFLLFMLLLKTHHTNLNSDSGLGKLGKAAWTHLGAPSWRVWTGSFCVRPAAWTRCRRDGDKPGHSKTSHEQSALSRLHAEGEKL